MTKKSRPELMIAAWPDRGIELPDYNYTCVSYKLPLRMVDTEGRWLTDEQRAANDLGLYIWADIDGTVSIDMRAMDIYSASVHELETRLKLLKRLNAKATKAGFTFHAFHRATSVFMQLLLALEAIGIRSAVEYHGINQPETYVPMAVHAQRIANAIDAQLNRLKQREAA